MADSAERNIVSGNVFAGIVLADGAIGTRIAGNYAGLNAAGTAALGNGTAGILISTSSATIVGTNGDGVGDSVEGNVSSGNGWDGVRIVDTGNTGTIVAGNYLGTDATGVSSIRNGFAGVAVHAGVADVRIGTNADGVSDTLERNILAGNQNEGVWIRGTNNVTVAGNFIGLNVNGTALANGQAGVDINGAAINSLIGTNSDGVRDDVERNIISSSGTVGVFVRDSGTANNRIVGNYIGTDATGSTAMGNTDDSIRVTSSAAGTQITNNVIAASTAGDGIEVSSAGSGTTIRGNLIGLAANGTTALGNLRASLYVLNTSGVTVGGPNLSDRNIVSAGQIFNGVQFSGSSNGIIQNNYIGTDQTGSAARPNRGEAGVLIDAGSTSVQVLSNLISGNSGSGLIIRGSGTNNTIVTGNIVGLAANGSSVLSNAKSGIDVNTGAANTRIGTNGDGVNDTAERNLISGNTNDGIWIKDSGTSGTVVAGNYIGTDSTGLLDRGNAWSGVTIHDGATGTIIGTNGSNDSFNVNERNVISGNDGYGIYTQGSAASYSIAGNYIGVAANGTQTLGNSFDGIFVNAVLSAVIGTNGDGIADLFEGNVISGNLQNGIELSGASGTARIMGNKIGTNAAGSAAIANAGSGIYTATSGTFIGTNSDGVSDAFEVNVISGNSNTGITVTGSTTSGVVIAGNYVGTNPTGTTAIPNVLHGVLVTSGAQSTRIGTNADGFNDVFERNVIAGNTQQGIYVSGAHNSVIAGNYIGVNGTGSAAIGNHAYGIRVDGGSTGTRIGTDGNGTNDVAERNIIGGSTFDGIRLAGSATSGTIVAGNYIGVGADGATAIPNTWGIGINGNVSNTRIGTDGSNDAFNANERNVISGNASGGLFMNQSNVPGSVIAGNYVGISAAGTAAVPNIGNGIFILGGASGVRIGSNSDGVGDGEERNIVSGNQGSGIVVSGSGTNDTVVAGNYIGTNAAGTASISNTSVGVFVTSGAARTLIGGSSSSARNVISGNTSEVGIFVSVASTTDTKIQGNYIGTNASGSGALANGRRGIDINAAVNTIIGTNGDGVNDATEGNLISGNSQHGVWVSNGASNTVVAGNLIGTNAAGTSALANSQDGIRVEGNSPNTRIGTNGDNVGDTLERNVISGNTLYGVTVLNTLPTVTKISGNYIGTNATGTAAIGNLGGGVQVSNGRVILGTDSSNDAFNQSERNVISGNGVNVQQGVFITGIAAANSVVAGNYIGLNAAGTAAIANQLFGINIDSSASLILIGSNGDGFFDDIERNVISGNANTAVAIASSSNIIRGNYIGLNSSGTAAIANSGFGIGLGGATGVSNNVIDRNTISGNSSGISLNLAGVTNTVVTGNIIGLAADGITARPNTGTAGIWIRGGSSNNRIGTNGDGVNDTAERNIIAGNSGVGIQIDSATSTDNVIAGNYIGLGIDGSTALSNLRGINVNGAVRTRIGTDGNGTNDAAERNVISAGRDFNILIAGSTVADTVVAGNYIGTDATGELARPNGTGYGSIAIDGGALRTRIGTDGSNDSFNAAERNIIAASGNEGIGIAGATTADTIIAGNTIGLSASGARLANRWAGLNIYGGLNTRVGTDSNGISDADERNVISGNTNAGIVVSSALPTLSIRGNYIGTNVAGTAAINNGGAGITFINGVQNVVVGGPLASDRNVISGNSGDGISIAGSSSNSNIAIVGNYIGAAASGTTSLANAGNGITIADGANNIRIGTDANGLDDSSEGNVISGNANYGIYISGSGTNSNRVAGNKIGTDVSGTLDLGNAIDGVRIENSASNNTVGGTVTSQRNIVSGNNSYGVDVRGSGTNGNTVIGNYLGLNAAGTASLGNTFHGASIAFSASGTSVTNNVASGNGDIGILVWYAQNSIIQGNIVGLNPTGTVGRGNLGNAGILVTGSQNTLIGTNGDGIGDAAERNIISGNSQEGIQIEAGDLGTTIAGNYIGTNISGTAAIPNTFSGILIWGDSQNTRIGTNGDGSNDEAERNVISGNSSGVHIDGFGSRNNVVAGNFIGTDASGTAALGNARSGVLIDNSASFNTVGGTTAAMRNIISGNNTLNVAGGAGVSISGSGTTGNVVAGNYLGTNVSGTLSLGNFGDGVFVGNSATNNTIGGLAPTSGNTVSGNNGDGIEVNGAASTGNVIQGNFIGTNKDGTGPTAGAISWWKADGVVTDWTGGNNGVLVGNAGYTAAMVGQGFLLDGSGDALRVANATNLQVQDLTIDAWVKRSSTLQSSLDQTTEPGGMIFSYGTGGYALGLYDDGRIFLKQVGGTSVNSTSLRISTTNLTHVAVTKSGSSVTFFVNGIAETATALTATFTFNSNAAIGAVGDTLTNSFYGVIDDLQINQRVLTAAEIQSISSAGIRGKALGNAGDGVKIVGAVGTAIGGTAVGARNIISGNNNSNTSFSGITVTGSANSTSILGNYVGTDATGSWRLGNSGLAGISVSTGSNTVIGGPTAAARNLVSGNRVLGVSINGSASANNSIIGNYIGTDVSGSLSLGNTSDGVRITSAVNTLIGGTSAGAGNLISGNKLDGIDIRTGATGTVVQGNLIGTDATGVNALGNGTPLAVGHGITFDGSSNTNTQNNLIGGTVAGSRNIITSNSGEGIFFVTAANGTISNNTIQGNYIGLNVNGEPQGNTRNGIRFDGSLGPVTNNTIGGSNVVASNVISANASNGISIAGVSSANNSILGNYIGTNATGAADFGNSGRGISITGGTGSNVVGNLVSGNNSFGIEVSSATATSIRGNLVGTDVSGTRNLRNESFGIWVGGNATDTIIGGTSTVDRNVIAFNFAHGIGLSSAGTGSQILGNYIGVDATGLVDAGNRWSGIEVRNTPGVLIGDSSEGARNIISGNDSGGISFTGNGSINGIVRGNYIGLDRTGLVSIPGAEWGIYIGDGTLVFNGETTARNITIGGNVAGAGNVIAGHYAAGVWIAGDGATGNVVAGNLIGTNALGQSAMANAVGVRLSHNANGNLIGGSTSLSRNIISGNTTYGVLIEGALTTNNTLQGNYIGTDRSGSLAISNILGGVEIISGANGNYLISNVISGNEGGGVRITGSNANILLGNRIGTDAAGLRPLPNGRAGAERYGVKLDTASGTMIGGLADGDRNIISGNRGDGVLIVGQSTGNVLRNNAVGTDVSGTAAISNTANGINLASDQATSNTIGGVIPSWGNLLYFNLFSGLRLDGTTATTASNNLFEDNVFRGNLELAIDIGARGPTNNDPNDADGLPNAPVITAAFLSSETGMLVVEGYSRPGRTIQIFSSSPTSNGRGQGTRRLASLDEGAIEDLDSGVNGSYFINGLGSDISANLFRFEIPLGDPAIVQFGDLITAVAIGSTSEFGNPATVGDVASNLAPTITLSTTEATLVAGASLTVNGSFSDSDSNSWSATVDFGDGSPMQVLELTSQRTFLINHTYADGSETPYLAIVTITDNGGKQSIATIEVTVNNQAPINSFNELVFNSVVDEGGLVTLNGSFEDTGELEKHTVEVVWGDGQSDILLIDAGLRRFTATHRYVDDGVSSTSRDNYRIEVTVRDATGESSSPFGLILEEVNNVAPRNLTLASSVPATVVEGSQFAFAGSFSDPGLQDSHEVVIDWGDGSEAQRLLLQAVLNQTELRAFALNHTYADNPLAPQTTYTITVDVNDDDEPTTPTRLQYPIVVTNALPIISNVTLSNNTIDENQSVALSVAYSDAGTRDVHTVIIDWGDGSAPTELKPSPGTTQLSGLTHLYRDNAADGLPYTITVKIADQDMAAGVYSTATTNLTVHNFAPIADAVKLYVPNSSGDWVLVQPASVSKKAMSFG